MKALAENEVDRFIVYNVFPFHLVALFPDQVAWFRVTPLASDRCRLDTTFLIAPEDLRTLSEAEKEEAVYWFDVINREDLGINITQQRGLRSQHARPGRLNKLETDKCPVCRLRLSHGCDELSWDPPDEL